MYKNIEDLRDAALGIVAELRAGTIDPKIAVEMNNAIGKACQTLKLELEYAAMKNQAPAIPFLEARKKESP